MHEELQSKTDEELAAFVQGNNQEAFGVLMDRYQAKLLRYGTRFLARPEHIEDAVQDIFIKAYENIRSFDATRRFSPWIYRIAHNTFVNLLRKQRREPLTFIDFDTLISHPSYERDPAQEEEKNHMRNIVEKGLELIAPKYKEILILYYLEEQSYQEIADILQIPTGTVGVRLKRAREALRRISNTHSL